VNHALHTAATYFFNSLLEGDEAVGKGITINGLPFMLKRPSGRGEIEDLDLYYRDCVMVGQGRSSSRCGSRVSSPRRSGRSSCERSQVSLNRNRS
jgi:hypothetical protein